MNKKALGPVVATSLLIVIVVISLFAFQTWYINYSSSIFSDSQAKSLVDDNLRIETIVGDTLYLNFLNQTELMQVKIIDTDTKEECVINNDNITLNTSNLIAHWSFDKYNETGIIDDSGNGHFARFEGGFNENNLVSGIGKAAKFDGKTNYPLC